LALACTDQLARARRSPKWTGRISAWPMLLEVGPFTGHYRHSADETGASRMPNADFAVVLLDEAERPKHGRIRFSVAYSSSILRKAKVFHRSGRMWIAMLLASDFSVAFT